MALLSMLERANQFRRTYGDPRAEAERLRQDSRDANAKRAFLDDHIRHREAARGANDVLRGSGFGHFFDDLDTKEAEAAFEGKGFEVGPINADGVGANADPRRSRLQQLAQSRGGGGRGGADITVQGPRRNPDAPVYAPADFQDMSLGGGVSSRGTGGGSVTAAAGATGRAHAYTDNDVPELMEQFRTRREDNTRRDALEGAETAAAAGRVPSALASQADAAAVRELLERIKAQAQVQRAEAAAGASRYRTDTEAATARMPKARPPADEADALEQLGQNFPGAVRPTDPSAAMIYDALRRRAGVSDPNQPGSGQGSAFGQDIRLPVESPRGMAPAPVPGMGSGGDADMEALIEQFMDEGLTDEEIMSELARRGGG